MLGFFGGALTDIKLKSYGTAFLYSTGDSGNLPMKKLKILMHINIFNLHKKIIIHVKVLLKYHKIDVNIII